MYSMYGIFLFWPAGMKLRIMGFLIFFFLVLDVVLGVARHFNR